MSQAISKMLEWKPKNQEDAKRPDPIDGLGRVGKIQEFLEDLDQLLLSDLPGLLLVLELLSNTLNMSQNSLKLLLNLLTVHKGHQQSKKGPHWSLINQYLWYMDSNMYKLVSRYYFLCFVVVHNVQIK